MTRRTIDRRRRRLLAALGAIALPGPTGAWGAGFASPADFIATTGEQVVATLRDGSLPTASKVQRITAVLTSTVDIPLVARMVLGRSWRDASEAQRNDYLALFNTLMVKMTAERMTRYAGGNFAVTGSRKVDDRDSVVMTRIFGSSGAAPVQVDWRVRQYGGDFKVVDLVVEGVSMVLTQRNEVEDIIARQGLDGLLTTMRDRAKAQAPAG